MSDRLTDRLISPPARATARKRANTHAETNDETNAQRNGDPPQPRRSALTDAEREAIHAAIDALPPMTDEQIEAIAKVILAARERRRHTRQTCRGPPLRSDAEAQPLVSGPSAGRLGWWEEGTTRPVGAEGRREGGVPGPFG